MQRTDQKRISAAPRGGFTLLEVIIAVAVLLVSLTAIFQLMSLGHRSTLQGEFRTQAVLHAETKMNEALAGVIPLSSATGTLDEDAAWTWTLDVVPGAYDGLLEVTVTVTRNGGNDLASHDYSMKRLVRDPQLFLDAALEE